MHEFSSSVKAIGFVYDIYLFTEQYEVLLHALSNSEAYIKARNF